MDYQRSLYISGFSQVAFGCLLGLVPSATWKIPRYSLTCHLEYTQNGALLLGFASAWKMFNLSLSEQAALFWLSNFGTWLNGTAFLVASFLGETTNLCPIANSQIEGPKPKLGTVATSLLFTCAPCIVGALGLAVFGLLRK